MHISGNLDIAGRLILKKYTLNNRLVEELTVKNDITMNGRTLVARLFNMNEVGDKKDMVKRVSKIKLGESDAPFDPKQTDLQGPKKDWETGVSKIEQIELKDKSRVMLRLVGELGENDCNGKLHEAGLFTEDGVMYNRVTFDTITKSDQFRLTLIWEITF